jgi:hypothetical protein
MDDLGFPVHGPQVETWAFDELPTIWLQSHIYDAAPTFAEWSAVVIHMSWFFVPPLAAILVTWRRSHRVGSFFRWWIGLQFLALPAFALFPLQPPWMASEEVVRIIALRHGGEIDDSNALAAMPSLHVAVPLVLSFWFMRERWTAPAAAMLAYALLVAFEVILSGEHYVMDVLGAVVFAAVVAGIARLNPASLLHWIARTIRSLRRRVPDVGVPVPVPAPASRPRRERAQALIEFALLLPLFLVFLLAIVDFGFAMDRRISLQHAVREGARYAAVHDSVSDIQQHTATQSLGIVDPADVDVCYENSNGNGSVGDAGDGVRVSATLTYEFPIMREIMGAFGVNPASIDMTPSGTARLEQSVTGGPVCP